MEESDRKEKIENYLMGRLDEGEAQSFRNQMEQDSELRSAVEDHQILLNQINTLFDYQASKIIKKVQNDANTAKSSRPVLNKVIIWLVIAAGAIALLFFAVQQFSSSTNEELYAAHYEPYEINFVQRGTNDKDIANAGAFYRNSDYSKALPLLVSAFSKDPKNTHIQMAIGICQHELKNYEGAIQTFKSLIDNNDPLYFDQASWYVALAYLGQDQIEICKEKLQLLTQSTSSAFKQKAQRLLEELN